MRVVPIRFTDDVPGMRRFLEALGLEPSIASDDGGWVQLRAAGGGIGLHAAATSTEGHVTGDVGLNFETDEPLEQVADRLRAAGFDPTIVDETWGRQLLVADPEGVVQTVNENDDELYGYTRA